MFSRPLIFRIGRCAGSAAAAPDHAAAPGARAPAVHVRTARPPVGARRCADRRREIDPKPASATSATSTSSAATSASSATARLCRGRRHTRYRRCADHVSAQQNCRRQNARQDLAATCAFLCHLRHLLKTLPPSMTFGEIPADDGSASPLAAVRASSNSAKENRKTLINREQGAYLANALLLHLHILTFGKVVPRALPGQTLSRPSDCPAPAYDSLCLTPHVRTRDPCPSRTATSSD